MTYTITNELRETIIEALVEECLDTVKQNTIENNDELLYRILKGEDFTQYTKLSNWDLCLEFIEVFGSMEKFELNQYLTPEQQLNLFPICKEVVAGKKY